MKTLDLFNTSLITAEVSLSDAQTEACKTQSAIAFFANVKPIFEIIKNDLTFDELVSELKLKVGDFSIIDTLETDSCYYVKVEPSDFMAFDLPTSYCSAFMEVCEFVILKTSLKNINMLKNIGISEMVQELPQLETLKNELNSKFNIGIGSTVSI